MEYLRPYQLPFKEKSWVTTILFLAIVILIPIVGVMVVLGYRSQLLDRWLKDGDDQRQKPFDFNNFGDYLQRGIWPFLYQLLIGLAIGMLAVFIYAAFIAVAIASNNRAIVFVAFIFYIISIFALQVIVKFVAWPFTLHGQITKGFDLGAAYRFSKDFYSRIGLVNLIGISICVMVLDVLVVLVGMMLLCVGIYAAAALVMLAENHFLWQLYRKYLAQGGQPIVVPEPNDSFENPDEPLPQDI
ncbi:MAG: DUF4013 domain-containing protein [Gemmataceae bacterium]